MNGGRGTAARGGSAGESDVSASVEPMSQGGQSTSSGPLKEGEKSYLAAAKPAPAIRDGKTVFDVVFNTWQIECDDRPVYQFDVAITLECRNDDADKSVSLNKGPKDEVSVAERSRLIRETLRAGMTNAKILSPSGEYVSDGAALLYANENLLRKLKPYGFKLIVPLDTISPVARALIRSPNAKKITVEFSETVKKFNSKDLSGLLNRERGEADQSVKAFYELILSEDAVRRQTFDSFSKGRLYRADADGRARGVNRFAEDVKFGQERRPGICKGFAPAEDKGRIIASLNLDVTTGTFWKAGNLEKLILELNEWKTPQQAVWNSKAIRNTNTKLKNLRVSFSSPDGKSSWDFVVSGISASAATSAQGVSTTSVTTIDQKTYMDGGKQVPLAKKFPTIKYKSWPLIVSKRIKRRQDDPKKFDIVTKYYPIELLVVKANQRVPLELHCATQKSPMRVEERFKQTNIDLEALNLFADTQGPAVNPLLKAFGINVVRAPLRSNAITRAMPTVEAKEISTKNTYALKVNEKSFFATVNCAFQTPAHITILFIAFAEDPKSFKMAEFEVFLKTNAVRKGMRIDEVQSEIVLPKDLYERMQKIQEEKKKDTLRLQRALFLFVEPSASEYHDHLKLFERRFSITTQHLTMEVARKMLINKTIVENFLMKMNVKAGGHNFSIKPENYATRISMDAKTLIIGYDVWHPTGQSRVDQLADATPPPSVVGFSFNGGVIADSFIGDYHYQSSRQERVEDAVLTSRIKWMLEVYERSRRVLPPLIIIVRDGISEGQYKYGMDELETLRKGAKDYAVSKERTGKTGKAADPNYSPKFIFVVATKRHNRRAYAKEGRDNMPAMSAVDDTITNPALFEFFLQAHHPLKGMAKPTKYTVLKDDLSTTQDEMQALMGALCFEHQITTSAISIPEPVFQADEWAKRGASNYRIFKEMFIDKNRYKGGVFTFEDLTHDLSYWNSTLGKVRVNA